jgi:molybdopterin-guanine dinucleotide biosynthesis protein
MSASLSHSPREARLPVTVITGFLGSGKTTLVKHILTNQEGLRTAVIVNELSEIGIDSELIVSATDDMVELENGCICCSINNDFLDAVFRILDRSVDYLVVETSGVSDPLPVVLTFLRSELRDRLRVDSIITVAMPPTSASTASRARLRATSSVTATSFCSTSAISSTTSGCERSRRRSARSSRRRASCARRSAGSRSLSCSASGCSSRIGFPPTPQPRMHASTKPIQVTAATRFLPATTVPATAI